MSVAEINVAPAVLFKEERGRVVKRPQLDARGQFVLTEPEQMHAIYLEELDESVSEDSDEEPDEGEDTDPFEDRALVRISPLDVEPWPPNGQQACACRSCRADPFEHAPHSCRIIATRAHWPVFRSSCSTRPAQPSAASPASRLAGSRSTCTTCSPTERRSR